MMKKKKTKKTKKKFRPTPEYLARRDALHALVRRAHDGDPLSVQELFARYEHWLHATALQFQQPAGSSSALTVDDLYAIAVDAFWYCVLGHQRWRSDFHYSVMRVVRQTVHRACRKNRGPLSVPYGMKDVQIPSLGITLEDLLVVDEEEEVHAVLDNEILHHELARAVLTLRPSQRKAIELYYGLDDGIPRKLRECAEIMCISLPRVQQHINNGLERLRNIRSLQEIADEREGK
jgi:RNA polymerase sigma factor (sigma-70 family)